MELDLMNVTKEDLMGLEEFHTGKPFRSVIIVPTERIHDSGWRCMRFVLTGNGEEVVGVIDTCTDIVHLNGIGGYGIDYKKVLTTGMVKRIAWKIDCLPCGVLRLFADDYLTTNDWIGSDFDIFVE